MAGQEERQSHGESTREELGRWRGGGVLVICYGFGCVGWGTVLLQHHRQDDPSASIITIATYS